MKAKFGDTGHSPSTPGHALVSFGYLPQVLDRLRMFFPILDVEVDAQHSQPRGKHLRGICTELGPAFVCVNWLDDTLLR